MTETLALPMSILAPLVAGHVNILWDQTVNQEEEDAGCCQVCCAPCRALADLIQMDVLDSIYAAYLDQSGGRDSAVWDRKNNQIDRNWLSKAWPSDFECH